MLIPKDDDVRRALRGGLYLSRHGVVSDGVSSYNAYNLLVGAIFRDEVDDIANWVMLHQDGIDWKNPA